MEATADGGVPLATAAPAVKPRLPVPAPAPPAGPERDALPAIRLHGVRLHAITQARCVEYILSELDAGRGGVVVTPNLDHLRRSLRDLTFGAFVAEADLVVADGTPLVWASRLQATPLPERVAGSDLISSLSAGAARRSRSVFLLGGAPGTADAAAAVLRKSNSTLRIAGTHCPAVGFEDDEAAMNELVASLVAAQPDIVFVGLGSPKQENLIERVRRLLPGAWWLGVGVSFSFLCGDVRRAPRWMQRCGLEWAHRLVQEPRRLFRRYIVVGLPFGMSLMTRSFLQGLPRRLNWQEDAAMSRSDTDRASGAEPPLVNAEPARPLAGPRRRRLARSAERSSEGLSLNTSTPISACASRSLHRLRAMVLLGGSVRATPLATSVARSVLDLPLDDSGSILNHWLQHAADLARHAGLPNLPVRVMVNRDAPDPISAAPRYAGAYRVERDLSDYRGTGGVLRDLAADYADDDLVMVLNAAQVLLDPLAAIATALDRKGGDVSVVSHNDGTPSGVMLVSCKTLRLIPTSGYVDMKEQALPAIAARYDVTVMHRRRPTGLPVRSLADYIQALRHYHRRRMGKPAGRDPLAEDWLPAFGITEDGARVAARAHVHDSIVLKGGIVEAGAVVVRSVVCPGGMVRKDRTAVDQLVVAGV